MRKFLLLPFAAAAVLGAVSAPALGPRATVRQEAQVGQPAPAWTLTDTTGVNRSLSDYSGKYVVLEWTNHQCPFVQKHYRTGNMQRTQQWARAHGVVWLSIVSSAPGSQGYVTRAQGEQILISEHSRANAKLLDPTGTVGHAYGAKTTPDVMIIDPKGMLIYSGGIDDKPTPDDADIKTAHNFVKAALEEAMAGKAVSVPTSQPYGCSVKYAG
jgi:peroxiredoxin